MPQTDKIKEIARSVLTSAVFEGRVDNWLWDRTERVANNIKMICGLPELSEANIPVDRFCLSGAGYFFETGLIQYVSSKGAHHDSRSEPDIFEVRRMSAFHPRDK